MSGALRAASSPVEHGLKLLLRLLVAAVFHEQLRQCEMIARFVLLIPDDVAIGGYSFLRLQALIIAESHFLGNLAAFRVFFGRCLLISLPELIACIVVFAQCQIFLSAFDVAVGTARCQQQECRQEKARYIVCLEIACHRIDNACTAHFIMYNKAVAPSDRQ